MLVLALAAYSVGASGDQPVGTIRNFGPNLQQTVCRQPEGIAVDPRGNLYASSNSDTATIGHVCVFNRHGTLVDIIEVPTGTSPVIGLLGELFDEDDGLYVVDQADNVAPNGRLLKINPRTHAVTLLAAGFSFPNAIAQDRHRNLYVSDSLTGQIARVARMARARRSGSTARCSGRTTPTSRSERTASPSTGSIASST